MAPIPSGAVYGVPIRGVVSTGRLPPKSKSLEKSESTKSESMFKDVIRSQSTIPLRDVSADSTRAMISTEDSTRAMIDDNDTRLKRDCFCKKQGLCFLVVLIGLPILGMVVWWMTNVFDVENFRGSLGVKTAESNAGKNSDVAPLGASLPSLFPEKTLDLNIDNNELQDKKLHKKTPHPTAVGAAVSMLQKPSPRMAASTSRTPSPMTTSAMPISMLQTPSPTLVDSPSPSPWSPEHSRNLHTRSPSPSPPTAWRFDLPSPAMTQSPVMPSISPSTMASATPSISPSTMASAMASTMSMASPTPMTSTPRQGLRLFERRGNASLGNGSASIISSLIHGNSAGNADSTSSRGGTDMMNSATNRTNNGPGNSSAPVNAGNGPRPPSRTNESGDGDESERFVLVHHGSSLIDDAVIANMDSGRPSSVSADESGRPSRLSMDSMDDNGFVHNNMDNDSPAVVEPPHRPATPIAYPDDRPTTPIAYPDNGPSGSYGNIARMPDTMGDSDDDEDMDESDDMDIDNINPNVDEDDSDDSDDSENSSDRNGTTISNRGENNGSGTDLNRSTSGSSHSVHGDDHDPSRNLDVSVNRDDGNDDPNSVNANVLPSVTSEEDSDDADDDPSLNFLTTEERKEKKEMDQKYIEEAVKSLDLLGKRLAPMEKKLFVDNNVNNGKKSWTTNLNHGNLNRGNSYCDDIIVDGAPARRMTMANNGYLTAANTARASSSASSSSHRLSEEESQTTAPVSPSSQSHIEETPHIFFAVNHTQKKTFGHIKTMQILNDLQRKLFPHDSFMTQSDSQNALPPLKALRSIVNYFVRKSKKFSSQSLIVNCNNSLHFSFLAAKIHPDNNFGHWMTAGPHALDKNSHWCMQRQEWTTDEDDWYLNLEKFKDFCSKVISDNEVLTAGLPRHELRSQRWGRLMEVWFYGSSLVIKTEEPVSEDGKDKMKMTYWTVDSGLK